MSDQRSPENKPEKTDLPDWVKFALETAKKIEQSGIALPSDLAERHDDYARARPKSLRRLFVDSLMKCVKEIGPAIGPSKPNA